MRKKAKPERVYHPSVLGAKMMLQTLEKLHAPWPKGKKRPPKPFIFKR